MHKKVLQFGFKMKSNLCPFSPVKRKGRGLCNAEFEFSESSGLLQGAKQLTVLSYHEQRRNTGNCDIFVCAALELQTLQ